MLNSKTVLPLVLFTLLLSGCFNVENTERASKSIAPPKGPCEVVFRQNVLTPEDSMTLAGTIKDSSGDWVVLDSMGEVRWIPTDAILSVIVTPNEER